MTQVRDWHALVLSGWAGLGSQTRLQVAQVCAATVLPRALLPSASWTWRVDSECIRKILQQNWRGDSQLQSQENSSRQVLVSRSEISQS